MLVIVGQHTPIFNQYHKGIFIENQKWGTLSRFLEVCI